MTNAELKQARLKAGLTQTQAANMIYVTLRAWQYYESGQRTIPKGYLELFTIKTTNGAIR